MLGVVSIAVWVGAQAMNDFARIANGREKWGAGSSVLRHRHDQAYAAIVLSGGYEESGSRGRFRVGPGDVLLHRAFDAHLNRFPGKGTQILNIVLRNPTPPPFALGRLDDSDAIARTAERDPAQASLQLGLQLREALSAAEDWPDVLASDLMACPNTRLDVWAQKHGLSPETVSRGFRKIFGQTPAAFRAEVRAQRAFALIVGSAMTMVCIAAKAGFADQAHMSRATKALTGASPRSWRQTSIPFKTEPRHFT
jgi:AraC-like DNA-binding protein